MGGEAAAFDVSVAGGGRDQESGERERVRNEGKRRVHIFITDRRTWRRRRRKGWGYVRPRWPFSPRRSALFRGREREKIVLCPEIKRCLGRYKCHRLTAGGVAAHADLRTIKKYVARASVPVAGTDTQLSNRAFIRVKSRRSRCLARCVLSLPGTVSPQTRWMTVSEKWPVVSRCQTRSTQSRELEISRCMKAAWNKQAKTVGGVPARISRTVTV